MTGTSPAQIVRRPHERSTRPNGVVDLIPPPGAVIELTEPGSTDIEVRTRPLRDLASTLQGMAGSDAGSTVVSGSPDGKSATCCPFTNSETVSVVALPTLSLTVAVDPDGEPELHATRATDAATRSSERLIDFPPMLLARSSLRTNRLGAGLTGAPRPARGGTVLVRLGHW